VLEILDEVTSDTDYSVGNVFFSTWAKALQVMFSSMDEDYTNNFFVNYPNKLADQIFEFLMEGETREYSEDLASGFQLIVSRVSKSMEEVPYPSDWALQGSHLQMP